MSALARRLRVPVALLASLGAALGAWGHTRNDSLATAAAATDSYEITCFDDGSGEPASLVLSIRDSSPGALPLVSVHGRLGELLVSASDSVGADAVPSPEVYVNGGAGTYTVLVTKTGPGPKFYSLTYHCTTGLDGSGVHTGSFLSVRQSQ